MGALAAALVAHGNHVPALLPAPARLGRIVHNRGTYVNPNRRLPRQQMLAARRIEQLSRKGA
jgi:hypothetical protein